MQKKVIMTNRAPKPAGPYSQAILVNDTVYVAGQLGIDPSTGQAVEGIEAQVVQALDNIQAILEEAGSSLQKVAKLGVFLKDLSDFQTLNKVFQERFPASPPARTTVQANLPGKYLVEIDAVATL